MKKYLFILIIGILLSTSPVHAWPWGSGYNEGEIPADAVRTNTDNFDNKLSILDINVQKALDTLDDDTTGDISTAADTEVLFNNGGIIDGEPNMWYDMVLNTLHIDRIIIGPAISDYLLPTVRGNANEFLMDNGSGNVFFTAITDAVVNLTEAAITLNNSNDTEIIYNDGGELSGDAQFVFDDNLNRVSLDGGHSADGYFGPYGNFRTGMELDIEVGDYEIGFRVGATAPIQLLLADGDAKFQTGSGYVLGLNRDDESIEPGHLLGHLKFTGDHGAGVDYREGASIRSYADGYWGATDTPARLEFWTTPDGSATTVKRIEIDNAGNTQIGDGGTTNYAQVSATGDLIFVGSAGLPFACMEGLNETITTAEDAWRQVTFDTVGEVNNMTIDVGNEEITVIVAGVYQVSVIACVHTAVAHDFEFLVKKNDGTGDLEPHLYQSTAVAGQIENVASTCLITVLATDRIELWVLCSDANGIDIIFDHVSLALVQVGG